MFNESPTVLCIDDNETIISFLSAYLKRHNFKIAVAFDGSEGLEKMKHLQPDIVILDINMPKLSGFDVAMAAMHDPSLQNIPIIILSALTQTHNKERAELRNVCYYLTKPVNPAHLINTINQCLEERNING